MIGFQRLLNCNSSINRVHKIKSLLVNNNAQTLTNNIWRSSTSNNKHNSKKKDSNNISKSGVGYDLIGPVDKNSQLRQYRFFVPDNESSIETEYRLLRERVLNSNHEYWSEQNVTYRIKRKKYISTLKQKDQIIKQDEIDDTTEKKDDEATRLNPFYVQFLNENFDKHIEYNRRWFQQNISLLWPAFRVNLYRAWKKITQKK